MEIKTLKQFAEQINNTVPARRKLAHTHLAGKGTNKEALAVLKETIDAINDLPRNGNKLKLQIEQSGEIMETEANYEIDELNKDFYFFKEGEKQFINYLAGIHEDFDDQLIEGLRFLNGIDITNFITDRDGTVNNYCARYNTSVQSAYNAVFLSHFAYTVKNAVLVTSAPLKNKGVKDISVFPENTFILAGSKGREYMDLNGNEGNFPINQEQQEILNTLSDKLHQLVQQADYAIFFRIGSGLQIKFGQITIARQDINNTITKDQSGHFLEKIRSIVKEVDPQDQHLRIEDTGLDIEITLTTPLNGSKGVKDYDKGDGISFLNDSLNLQLEKGNNLVCGDTESDIPMLEKCMEINPQTKAIFVTTDNELINSVSHICPNSIFVNTPDILITLLNQKAKEKL
ncbi:MAG: trehalose 6-phosphate synthase [Bacteroidota bacterium]